MDLSPLCLGETTDQRDLKYELCVPLRKSESFIITEFNYLLDELLLTVIT